MVGADVPGENFDLKPSRMAKNGFPRITPLSQDLLHFVDSSTMEGDILPD